MDRNIIAEALIACSNKFALYAKHHRAKGGEADEKAKVNDEMVTMLEPIIFALVVSVDERADFEVWATTDDRCGPSMSRDGDSYRDALVFAWWQAWQAGRASVAVPCSGRRALQDRNKNNVR